MVSARPIETVSAVEAVMNALRNRILSGSVPSSVPLTETDVSETFGVSRPTAKNAITMLVLEGLLVRAANHSAYVPSLSADDFQDIITARRMYEIQAATMLIARSVEMGRLRRLEIGQDPTGHDLAFHRALINSAQSPHMSRLCRSLFLETQLYWVQHRPTDEDMQTLVGGHADILDAIDGGDIKLIAYVMRMHLHAETWLAERILS